MRVDSRTHNMMRTAIVALVCCLMLPVAGQAQSPEQQVINDAAAALGGRDKIMAVKTMTLQGGGYNAGGTQSRWDDGLGFYSAVNQLRDINRNYDLAAMRMRIEQTSQGQYMFYVGDAPNRQIQALDGQVAFNVGANGTPTRVFGNQVNGRRLDYLRHPLTLIRAALGPDAKLSNSRTEGSERLVDIVIGDLPKVTLAINATTKLPTKLSQMVDNTNMGDTQNALEFSDYKAVNGVQVPTLLRTLVDGKETGAMRFYQVSLDGTVPDLAAPAAVASAKPPAPNEGRTLPNDAQEIAKGLWFVTGTTHHSLIIEFADHLTILEAPNSERVNAVWAKAKELRPNKPITTLIVTHHHGDHTAGVRDAVARGVTEIIFHESNLAYIKAMLSRPHTINPDALAKMGASAKMPKLTTIGDQGVVKDATMTVNLYHILDNTHADSMLAAYFPDGKIFTQADIYMPRDERHIIPGEPLGHAPWNRNVMENIKYRKLDVAFHAPIHGDYVPQSKFIADTITMTQYQPGEEPQKKATD